MYGDIQSDKKRKREQQMKKIYKKNMLKWTQRLRDRQTDSQTKRRKD